MLLPDDDVNVHYRRSIRLKGYDYAQAGAYFVTMCTQDRACLLGDVVGEEVRLSDAGSMIQAVWEEIPDHYPGAETDEFVVMPNHIHGIIAIPGRGESCIRPGDSHQPDSGDHKDRPYGTMAGSLGRIIQAFKSTTTHEYVMGTRQCGWPTFRARLWQRGYFEHVVRDDRDLERIREYIATNPLRWAMDRENPQRAGSSPAEGEMFDLDRAP